MNNRIEEIKQLLTFCSGVDIVPLMSTKPKLKKSERTRLAILEAARVAFRDKSYDHVGLRELAAKADVTAALVNRYFGSKQKLFRAVVQDDTDYSELYEAPQGELGRRLAQFLINGEVRKKNGELLAINSDKFTTFVRSVACPEAVPILRETVAEKITGPLKQSLPGDRIEEKASLLISHFFGFLVVHSLLGATCAVEADPIILEEQLAASLQAIIDC